MKFVNHSEIYFGRMNASVEQKTELIHWIKGGAVAELGPGSGSLTELIATHPEVTEVLALDASAEAILHLAERFDGNGSVTFSEAVLGEHPDPFGGKQFSAIVASSLFHEVYSFVGAEGVMMLADQIVDALLPGGMLIIRDGVTPDRHDDPARMKVASRLLELAARYCEEGPELLRPKLQGNMVYGTRHQVAEMAFTITWGEDSFDREVQEQYQIYDLAGGELFYSSRGLDLIHSEAVIQPGYKEHLADSPIEFCDGDAGWASWFPDTNAIWVFEKPAN